VRDIRPPPSERGADECPGDRLRIWRISRIAVVANVESAANSYIALRSEWSAHIRSCRPCCIPWTKSLPPSFLALPQSKELQRAACSVDQVVVFLISKSDLHTIGSESVNFARATPDHKGLKPLCSDGSGRKPMY